MKRLENGKTYEDGTGSKVTVQLERPDTEYPFTGSNGFYYMADGRYIPDPDLSVAVYNLIREVK